MKVKNILVCYVTQFHMAGKFYSTGRKNNVHLSNLQLYVNGTWMLTVLSREVNHNLIFFKCETQIYTNSNTSKNKPF
jgi:hypothetical protein